MGIALCFKYTISDKFALPFSLSCNFDRVKRFLVSFFIILSFINFGILSLFLSNEMRLTIKLTVTYDDKLFVDCLTKLVSIPNEFARQKGF